MRNDFRRAVRLAVWALLAAALPAAAVVVEVPQIGMETGLGVSAPAAFSAAAFSGVSASLTAPALSPFAAPAASLSAAPLTAAPLFAAPAPLAAPALAPAAALAPASVPLSASAVGAAPAAAESASAPALDVLRQSAASHGPRRNDDGARFFDGARAARPDVAPVRGASGQRGQKQPQFIKNADGVWVGGRVAEQAVWINKMYAELSPIVDLADVMNVMDDAYDEARVKLGSVERAAADRQLAASSVHLEGTRNWVDAILTDKDGKNIAVHTHRVYFHPAPGNPASEIAEGIRRVDKYLDKAKDDFAAGGLAEQSLNTKFAAVELNFDTRGYKEIADHIKTREAEFRAAYGDRYQFRYITEPKMASKPLRAEYNRLVEKYMDQPEGLMGILDGVTYSREVGVGHELNSHKKRLAMGLKITQAGRDFFGKKVLPDGRIVEEYKTEFDAVTEPVADQAKAPKDRDVTLWEDKSTRVWMTLEKTMEETFLYKLRIYRENRSIIEASLGGAPLKVAFSVDVGGTNRRAAKQGVLVWKDARQKELMEHLKAVAPALSAEFGFPVSFIFVNSHPGEDPDLFSKTPVEESDWQASQNGGGKSGRKHQGNGRRR
ncbi:MAG: hypothetical protein KGJ84_14005 [Elusimicrobia bacterium]|nr:hypothetical protein [Elusimicrobiota bacterium]